uniref:hypothetical protein n=1 Tax=Brachybacterium sp. GPGPB12 TaxID=3023517 RepID=UPI00404B363F
MPAALHPCLNVDGNAREASEFYGEALGATPQFATFGEFHAVPEGDPAFDKIMHGSLEVTDLIRLYVSDVVEGMGEYTRGTNVALSLMGDDEAVCAAPTRSCRSAARSRCRSRSRCGAMSTAPSPTASASCGRSTSPAARAEWSPTTSAACSRPNAPAPASGSRRSGATTPRSSTGWR